jgi:hypothetical protein
VRGPPHRLARNIGRSLARFRYMPPTAIPAVYARAMRLNFGWAAPRPRPPRAGRVVISLSTVPSRVSHLRPVLNSLLDQSEPADRIVLAMPRYSLRERRPYPAIADLRLPRGVEVVETDDLGPATKILPILGLEPDAVVIVVDDDVVYPHRFVETLLAAHRRHPGAALGYRGIRLEPERAFVDHEHVFATAVREDHPVDVLFGTWGYLVPPGALSGDLTIPAELRWVDDVWVSGQLARRGIARLVVPASEIPVETINAARLSLSGGPNKAGANDRRAIEAFAAHWSRKGATDAVVVGRRA